MFWRVRVISVREAIHVHDDARGRAGPGIDRVATLVHPGHGHGLSGGERVADRVDLTDAGAAGVVDSDGRHVGLRAVGAVLDGHRGLGGRDAVLAGYRAVQLGYVADGGRIVVDVLDVLAELVDGAEHHDDAPDAERCGADAEHRADHGHLAVGGDLVAGT